MRKPTVFLITGYARAGKDTAAQAIAETLGCEVVSFADRLKDAVNAYFVALGIERVNVHETADKVRFRELLVAAGRAARSVDANVFADHVALECHLALMRGKCIVVSDWRYYNEFHAILRKVGRDRVVPMHVGKYGNQPANQEEADSVSSIIDNNAGIGLASAYFKDGDTGALRDWAVSIANEHAIHVPAA